MAGEPATALATSDLSIATTSLSLILPQESSLPLVSRTLRHWYKNAGQD